METTFNSHSPLLSPMHLQRYHLIHLANKILRSKTTSKIDHCIIMEKNDAFRHLHSLLSWSKEQNLPLST